MKARQGPKPQPPPIRVLPIQLPRESKYHIITLGKHEWDHMVRDSQMGVSTRKDGLRRQDWITPRDSDLD